METKEELISAVRDWVKLDNEIRTLQKEQTKRKKDKSLISEKLMNIMKSNEIDCFDLKDGQICYNKKTVKKPITKKNLFDILSKYYDGDILKASKLNDFISDNREETTKETITRKINKSED
jgi:hypothetical protein